MDQGQYLSSLVKYCWLTNIAIVGHISPLVGESIHPLLQRWVQDRHVFDAKDLGRASLRSQSLTSGKTNAPSCNLALHCPCNPFLHSTYRCGLREASRHTNQTRTIHNSNLGAKLCQRPQAIRLREAVAFTENTPQLQS